MRFCLTGGDDYSLVATFPAGTSLPQPWRQIGTVLKSGEPGTVTVDGAEYEDPGGHQHFR
jgi:thiamine-monophosphate kinase